MVTHNFCAWQSASLGMAQAQQPDGSAVPLAAVLGYCAQVTTAVLVTSAIFCLAAALWLGLSSVGVGLHEISQSFESGGALGPTTRAGGGALLPSRLGGAASDRSGGGSTAGTGSTLQEMDISATASQVKWRKTGDTNPELPRKQEYAVTRRPLKADQPIESQLPGKVLFVVIVSTRHLEKHLNNLKPLCAQPWALCELFGDEGAEVGFSAESHMMMVPPAIYLNGSTSKSVGDCCGDPSRANPTATRFFCDGHRAMTLVHQYRFLPALAHVRSAHLDEWSSGKLSWLVLIDDDSLINIGRLLTTLSQHAEHRPLYMGDFGPWTSTINRVPDERRHLYSWKPPYACGGSGSIFSRTAVIQTDFGVCARRLHQGCYQSDWMIGQCAAEYKVMPVVEEPSCGTCLPCTLKPFKLRATLDTLTNQLHSKGKSCAFALFSPCSQQIAEKVSEVRRGICEAVLPQAAILHGTAAGTICNQSTEDIAAWKVAPLGQIGRATPPPALPAPAARGSKSEANSSSGGGGDGGNASSSVGGGAKARRQSAAPTSTNAPTRVSVPVPVAAAPPPPPPKIKIEVRNTGISSLRAFLAQLGLLQYKKSIVRSLGVASVADLGWVEMADLQTVSMSDDEQKTFMGALQAPELQREKYDIDVSKRLFPGDGAVMSVLRQIRLLKARERIIGKQPGQLHIRSLSEMKLVTDEQLKAAAFPPVTRRRFLAAMKTMH